MGKNNEVGNPSIEQSLAKNTFTQNNSKKWLIPVLLGIIVILTSTTGYFTYQSIKTNLNNSNNDTVPDKTTAQSEESSAKLADFAKTNILGRGIVFNYPAGWHVATYQPTGEVFGDPVALVSKTPIVVDSAEGPISNISISVQNGLSNPENALDTLYAKEKESLVNIEEETISNKFFNKIYHLKGNLVSDAATGAEYEKYFFITDNPKYKNLSDKQNLVIFMVSGKPSNLLNQVVMSIRYCSYITCSQEIE